jgi:hypothetical protein
MNQDSSDRDDHPHFLQESAAWSNRARGQVLAFCQGIVGIVGGVVLAYVVGSWIWPERGSVMVLLAGAGAIVGFFAGLVLTAVFVRGTEFDPRQRLAAYLMTGALFVGGCLLPIAQSKEARRSHMAQRTAASLEESARIRQRESDWLADIDAAGAHDAAGVEPPVLRIEHRDERLLVSSNSDRILECVRISRATTAWQHEACRMSADSSGASCRKLQPGTTAIFELPPTAAAECSSLPLSFEIGNPENPDPTWWSDPALAARRASVASALP